MDQLICAQLGWGRRAEIPMDKAEVTGLRYQTTGIPGLQGTAVYQGLGTWQHGILQSRVVQSGLRYVTMVMLIFKGNQIWA